MQAGTGGAGEERDDLGDGPLDRLVQGLNHPLRRRILCALAEGGRGGAKTLSEQLGVPLANISYHLNKVLAEQCGLVELVERIPRRGAEEKIYRLDQGAIDAGLDAIRRCSCVSSLAFWFRPEEPS